MKYYVIKCNGITILKYFHRLTRQLPMNATNFKLNSLAIVEYYSICWEKSFKMAKAF